MPAPEQQLSLRARIEYGAGKGVSRTEKITDMQKTPTCSLTSECEESPREEQMSQYERGAIQRSAAHWAFSCGSKREMAAN